MPDTHPAAGRKPFDTDALSADSRAHRATRVASRRDRADGLVGGTAGDAGGRVSEVERQRWHARLSTRRDPWYPRRDNTGVTCWERTERVRWTSCASAQQHERNEKIVYLGHPGFMPRRCSMEGKTLRRTTVALLLAGAVASTPLSS